MRFTSIPIRNCLNRQSTLSFSRWSSNGKVCQRLFVTNAILRSEKDSYDWASKEAREALKGFKERFENVSQNGTKPVSQYYQQIDSNQIHLSRITLANMLPLLSSSSSSLEENQLKENEENLLADSSILQNGIPFDSSIIPSEHLCFFTPRVTSSSLGLDGSDTNFNPPGGIFTRRMWAGGEMEFINDDIKVGDLVWEKTFVEDAQLKKLGGNRGEMIVVWVKKEFGKKGKEDKPSLIDRRSWVYQRALDNSSKVSSSDQKSIKDESFDPINLSSLKPPKDLLNPTLQFQNAANLFRYSALTFNAHAIHLSPPWAQNVEGHKDIVVHGPLNLSLLVRKWGREIGKWKLNEKGEFIENENNKIRLQSVKYRAKKPVYANQPYWIGIQKDSQSDNKHTVLVMHPDGQIAMEATITSTST